MLSLNSDYSDKLSKKLQGWMQTAGLSSLRSLSQVSGVSRRQIEKLRVGESHRLSVEHAIALARALNISLATLLELEDPSSASAMMQTEYQRLQGEMEAVRSQVFQSFQAETLNTLEMLLVQWPTAAHAAQQNPELPAVRLLPLLRPIEQLLQGWQIEVIGEVGQAIGYNPQWHQWQGMEAPPEPDMPVRVTHVGYRQGDRLLYRAKVKLLNDQ